MKNKKLFSNERPFFIAEVGQNHQGELEHAREYIRIFSDAGAHAIKFQTRDNKFLFSKDAYEAPYTSHNAFASVYGHHREKLELKTEWLPILRDDCHKNNVLFMSTPFDEPSLKLLVDLDVDIIKIASFDLGNLPFISKIASTNIPVVMSIGGGKSEQIDASVKTLLSAGSEVTILHCVSEYPCPPERLGLSNIPKLIKKFPELVIGSSDHFNGILSGSVAWMLGARVFEKHVTLNRGWKGTDHGFALEREGFRKFVRDIYRVPQMMHEKPIDELGEEPVFKKLGKSIVASHDIHKGETFSVHNLSGKIFKDIYIPVRKSNEVIGQISKVDIKKDEPILSDFF